MSAYERNGIVVDQCTGCRGLFLDRGELEGLGAETGYYNRPPAHPGDRQRHPGDSHPDPHRDRDPYRDRDRGDRKSRRRSFLDELFD